MIGTQELEGPRRVGSSRDAADLDERHATFERVVVLRYVADLSVAEIAARTGRREGMVNSHLCYALRELRAAYDAVERTPEETR